MLTPSCEPYLDLDPLLKPQSIAIVGASENAGAGRQVLENLVLMGYKGSIYPVNPRFDEILGFPCYSSLREIDRAGYTVDMAAILLKRDSIVPVLEEAASVGVRAAWAFANGFGEAGPKGKALQTQLTDICRKHHIRFCGPNCVGYLHPGANVGAYSAPAPANMKPGKIGMIAQSGYLTITVANSHRIPGFSMLCSSGNEAVVDSTDFISYMLEDSGTEIILAFIEQFRKPERLVELADRAKEKKKPIILIKTGRSEMARRATLSHTGAIAGSDDVQGALFEKLGIIRVDDLDEMFETAELFSKLLERLPEGEGIFCVTLSGGIIGLIADLGESLQLTYPAWSNAGRRRLRRVLPSYTELDNPIDVWGFGRIEETYETCLRAAGEEAKADLILIAQDVPPGMAVKQAEQYQIVADAAVKVSRETSKPVVILSNPSVGFHPDIRAVLEGERIPLLQGTREGLKAISHFFTYAAFRRRDESQTAGIHRSGTMHPAVKACFESGRKILTEYTSKIILTAYSIRCPDEILCQCVEECCRAAEEMGFPVALKVVSPEIQHKTEASIIRLNLTNSNMVSAAFDSILLNARTYAPNASIDGVLCQKMVEGIVAEVIVGIVMDRDFGPAVVFGTGGVTVEVFKDRALGIPPLNRNDALRMIERTRGSRLLSGFRGAPRGDLDALIDALIRVGDLAVDASGRIASLDINPLLVLPEGRGVSAVDALIVLKETN